MQADCLHAFYLLQRSLRSYRREPPQRVTTICILFFNLAATSLLKYILFENANWAFNVSFCDVL